MTRHRPRIKQSYRLWTVRWIHAMDDPIVGLSQGVSHSASHGEMASHLSLFVDNTI